MNRFKYSLIAVLAVLSFAVAAPAMAQDSSLEGYGNDEVEVGPDVDQGGDRGQPGDGDGGGGREPDTDEAVPAGGDDDAGGRLPFTGLDIGLLAVAGGGLALMGLGMRRLTRLPDVA